MLLDPTYIRDICDYSFGDESGHNILGGYMKPANMLNAEFINKCNEVRGNKPYMTLFIDNIRLYKRDGIKYTALEESAPHIKEIKDRKVQSLGSEDLLELCSYIPDINFIIFTAFEDTPIDEFIEGRIPENVLKIFASNAIYFGGKVVPYPYGIQRKLSTLDNRHEILLSEINHTWYPSKLLYINHRLANNSIRGQIDAHFSQKEWATVHHPISIRDHDYLQYLKNIQSHKFMICPSGNAIGCECHRDWEVLYMRRVPVVERSPYLEYIFKDFPVLFVDSFFEVTEELLLQNDYLYDEVQNLDMSKLDIEVIYKKLINE